MSDEITNAWLKPSKKKGEWKKKYINEENSTIGIAGNLIVDSSYDVTYDSTNFTTNAVSNNLIDQEFENNSDLLLSARNKNFIKLNNIHYLVLNGAKQSKYHHNLFELLKEKSEFNNVVLSFYKRGPALSIVLANIMECEIDRISYKNQYIQFEGLYDFSESNNIVITIDEIKTSDIKLLKETIQAIRDTNAVARIYICAYFVTSNAVSEIDESDVAGKTEVIFAEEIDESDNLLYPWTFVEY